MPHGFQLIAMCARVIFLIYTLWIIIIRSKHSRTRFYLSGRRLVCIMRSYSTTRTLSPFHPMSLSLKFQFQSPANNNFQQRGRQCCALKEFRFSIINKSLTKVTFDFIPSEKPRQLQGNLSLAPTTRSVSSATK